VDDKELKVLKYLKERIEGNNNTEYQTDVPDYLIIKEIGYYLEKLFDKKYVIAKNLNWAIRGGQRENQFRSNLVAIIYDHLKISQEGEKAIKEAEKTKIEKVADIMKEEGKIFAKEIHKEGRTALAKYVVFIMGLILFLLIGVKILKLIGFI
jgi:hypothetical protein